MPDIKAIVKSQRYMSVGDILWFDLLCGSSLGIDSFEDVKRKQEQNREGSEERERLHEAIDKRGEGIDGSQIGIVSVPIPLVLLCEEEKGSSQILTSGVVEVADLEEPRGDRSHTEADDCEERRTQR
jgi:hypothetical protein